MKPYIFALVFAICLFLPCAVPAQQEEAYEIPEISQEIEALRGDPPVSKTKEFYRLLRKDSALASYQPDLPQSRYDPRQLSKVTPVRSQRANTCWAFSSLAAGEESLVYKGLYDAASLDLSEAQLTYFFYHPVPDPLGNTKGDGNYNISALDFMAVGSNTIFSTFALANWIGAAQEEAAPFEGLSPDTVYDEGLAYADVAHLQNAYWINFKDVDSVNVIKQMILKYGAAAINLYWGNRYYNGDTFAYYFPLDSSQSNNHSVTVVGWDDNFPKEKFAAEYRPKEDGAWIAKNSYGASWGDGGYFYLSYEDSSVNSGNTSVNRARAYVFDFEPADNYDYNYQYDGSAGAFNATNPDSPLTKVDSGGCIANIFTVKGQGKVHTQTLRAVSFALLDTAVSYRIQVYKNLSDRQDPASGTAALLEPVTGGTSYAGYYTIPLDTPVLLEEGETFSVVIQLEKESGGQVNFFVDKSYQNGNWIAFTNETQEGQSFRILDGEWEDLAKYGITARVKAFTDAGELVQAENIILQGVGQDIEGNYFLNLWSDEVYTMQASVFPAAASQRLTWETSDASVVSVSETGALSPVSGGTAVITGRTSDGSGLTVSCKVHVLQRAKQIVLCESFLELEEGERALLTAELLPKGAYPEEILWESSGRAASVDESGAVEAVKKGEAIVRAWLKSDESICALCHIQVSGSAKEETNRVNAGAKEDSVRAVEEVGAPEDKQGVQPLRAKGAKTSDFIIGRMGIWIAVLGIGGWLLQWRKRR